MWRVCVSELKFSIFTPSAVACSCVTAAVIRLNVLTETLTADALLQVLRNLLNVDEVRTVYFQLAHVGLEWRSSEGVSVCDSDVPLRVLLSAGGHHRADAGPDVTWPHLHTWQRSGRQPVTGGDPQNHSSTFLLSGLFVELLMFTCNVSSFSCF